jgi:stress response protein YsnF
MTDNDIKDRDTKNMTDKRAKDTVFRNVEDGDLHDRGDRVSRVEGDVLEVVQEEVQVGKRQVESGVRASTHVTETPVERDVNLREERVHVERRPVDRPADANAFREQTIEATEYVEEVVVSKSARVIEEIVFNKDVSERTAVVSDTVRRTDVEVEDLRSGELTSSAVTSSSTGGKSFETHEADFRKHYDDNYASSGYSYEQFTPAYRYGHGLASRGNHSDSDWTTVEQHARRGWEEKNQGTWEEFKEAVRQGWHRVRGA